MLQGGVGWRLGRNSYILPPVSLLWFSPGVDRRLHWAPSASTRTPEMCGQVERSLVLSDHHVNQGAFLLRWSVTAVIPGGEGSCRWAR